MIVAAVDRSGFSESFHHGSIAVTDVDGRPIAAFGDVEEPFFVRSAAKPFQAEIIRTLIDDPVAEMPARSLVAKQLALSTEQLALSAEQLALAAASHDGEPVHVALVRSLLVRVGLDESALRCPPSWPSSATERSRVQRDGADAPRRIWHNCSGKHAAMLSACVAQGWSTEGYLERRHPLQQFLSDGLERAFSGPNSEGARGWGSWGVDGCGAPVASVNAAGLARAFGRASRTGTPVISAMRRFPALVGGERHVDYAVMVALPAVAKRGAEAVFGIGIEGRGGIGIKIWDGAERAVGPVVFETLDQLGWIPHGSRQHLEWRCRSAVLGGGMDVGTVSPAFRLESL